MRRIRVGYTLVELMTLIAIIVIILSLLVPVIMNIRRSIQQTSCLSNLRNLGIAFASYLADYDQRFPGSGSYFYYIPPEVDPIDTDTIGWTPFAVECGDRGRAELRKGALFPYVQDVRVYHCPSDTSCPDPSLSYSMNTQLSLLEEAFVQKPSSTILLLEDYIQKDEFVAVHYSCYSVSHRPDVEWLPRSVSMPCHGIDPPIFIEIEGHEFPFTEIYCNHNQGSNMLFVDLHSKWLPRGSVKVEHSWVF